MATQLALQVSSDESSQHYFSRIADALLELIHQLRSEVRSLYYVAVLFRRECPGCGEHRLIMERDSWCRCARCRHAFDPTLIYQSCPDCTGPVRKKTFHYWCRRCNHRVRSAYCFDSRVFDAAYFRDMMRISRGKKAARQQQLKRNLAQERSQPLLMSQEPSLDGISGLGPAIDRFVGAPIPAAVIARFITRSEFDMNRYRRHIRERVAGCVVRFDGISPVIEDRRLDRIFRFITVIFMEHDREIVTRGKDGVLVIEEYETHPQG